MNAYAPDVQSKHLAALDPTRGPFASIDAAAIYGTLAGLTAGRHVGYTGWLRGTFPARLVFVDGQAEAGNARTADKPEMPSRCHDPLAWSVAHASGNPALLAALLESARAVMRVDMPTAGGIQWAHQGAEPGWPGRADGGSYGHHAHVENALFVLLHDANDARARDVWSTWLNAMRTVTPTTYDRQAHCHLVRARLAALWTADAEWQSRAVALARYLVQKPLAQHAEALYHPGWPYAVWQLLGKEAEAWLVAGADWSGPAHSAIALSSIAYWITGNANYLTRHLPALVRWANSYFREPGNFDWDGLAPGRTGDAYAPNNWPLLKRGLLDAGIDGLPPLHECLANNYPMADGRFVDLRGADLRQGIVRFASCGGDTLGGRIRQVKGPGKTPGTWLYSAELNLEGPYGQNVGAAPYAWSNPVPAAQIASPWSNAPGGEHYEQVAALVSNDPTEYVLIQPQVRYEVGNCRATLTLDQPGQIAVQPIKQHVTFYGPTGLPLFGVWAGREQQPKIVQVAASLSSSSSLQPPAASLFIDARGPDYCRWSFSTTAPGRWTASR